VNQSHHQDSGISSSKKKTVVNRHSKELGELIHVPGQCVALGRGSMGGLVENVHADGVIPPE